MDVQVVKNLLSMAAECIDEGWSSRAEVYVALALRMIKDFHDSPHEYAVEGRGN